MKITFVNYEHSTIGFPRVKLKWAEENGGWQQPYLTIHGVVQPNIFQWESPWPQLHRENEIARFDAWVRERFSEDASVQG